jgi:hypothetical protein
MLPPAARAYVINGLEGTPAVLEGLLKGVSADDPVWDRRVSPERFSLREVLAHLADWEPIWIERIRRMKVEDGPLLPNVDEGQLAIDRNYAASDPFASMARFREHRVLVFKRLSELSELDWSRTGEREFVGHVTLENLATMMLGHDAYHLKQIAETISG